MIKTGDKSRTTLLLVMLSFYAIILIPNQIAGASTKFTSEVGISEIPVGKTPRGMAINPDNNRIYVVNERSNTTSVIDGNTNEVIKTIPVGEIPTGVAVNPKTNRTYVTSFGSNTISVIDGNTNEVINTIPVGESPGSIAVDPNDNRIYVASSSSDMISIIDGNTNEVLPTNITLGYSIGHIEANPHTNKLYMSCDDLGHRLCIIDTQTNRIAIVYSGAYSLAINADTNTIYAVNQADNTVSIIDGNTNSISKTIPVGTTSRGIVVAPGGIAVDPDDNRIYVSNPLFDTISVIDGKTILAGSKNIIADQYYTPGIKVGENPSKTAIDRDNNRIYVVNEGSDSVSVIGGSNDKVIDNIQVGRRPVDTAIDPYNNRIYVVNEGSDSVSVIDGNTNRLLPTNISVGHSPTHIAVNNDKIYVINVDANYDKVISVIDGNTNKVIKTIPVDESAEDIAVDPATDLLYVANTDSNSVSVIDARTNWLINTIPVGERPLDVNINEQTRMVYVANSYSNSVSVIDLEKKSEENHVTLASDGKAAILNPSSNLESSTEYTATITKEVKDVSGNPMASDKTWSFTTTGMRGAESAATKGAAGAAKVPTETTATAPTIVSTNPADGQKGIAIDSNVIATFNKEMNSSTINSSTFTLKKNGDTSNIERSPKGRIVDNVSVGRIPAEIAINPVNNRIYVKYGASNTISIIDGNTNRLLPTNISVGQSPTHIAINPDNNTIYLINSLSDAVSIIDGNTNDLVIGATFDVQPHDSGYIICDTKDSKDIPTNIYIRIKFRTQCKAIPSNGFAFNSWTESLGSNSSRTITKSSTAGSILNNFFSNPNDDHRTTFAVTSFGNFVANFREAPPPIPKEIWISLFGISLSVILPSLLRWYNGWKQRRRFYEYIEELPSKKKTFNLETINNEITQLYAKGKINESQHKMLKEKASEYYTNTSK